MAKLQDLAGELDKRARVQDSSTNNGRTEHYRAERVRIGAHALRRHPSHLLKGATPYHHTGPKNEPRTSLNVSKQIAPVMARTDFARIFTLLPDRISRCTARMPIDSRSL